METDPFAPESPPFVVPAQGQMLNTTQKNAQARLILWTSISLSVAFSSLALLAPWTFNFTNWMEPFVGYMIGTTYGVALMSAFWCTLGPGPFAYRVPLSLLWILGITFGWLGNHFLHRNSPPLEAILAIALSSCGMWLAPQLPLWCFRFMANVSVRLPDAEEAPNANQFGIRQMIIFTTLIALVLGAARIAVGAVGNRFPSTGDPNLGLGCDLKHCRIQAIRITLRGHSGARVFLGGSGGALGSPGGKASEN